MKLSGYRGWIVALTFSLNQDLNMVGAKENPAPRQIKFRELLWYYGVPHETKALSSRRDWGLCGDELVHRNYYLTKLLTNSNSGASS